MDELTERLCRFTLLRMRLAPHASLNQAPCTPQDLASSSHTTTRVLTQFVWNHTMGMQDYGPVDFIDLWQRLDREGRDEVVAYLREVVG